MTDHQIKASVRKSMSGGYRHGLFKQGLIPAVVYGKAIGNLPLEVVEKDVLKVVSEGRNAIINLSVSDNGGPYKVMVRDMQYHPVKKSIMHVDFQQVSLRDKVHVAIPINLSGEVADGLAQIALRELEISCLPAKIPDQITVDVSGLKPGDTIAVSDLKVPKGVTAETNPHLKVVTVLVPHAEPLADPVNVAAEPENGAAGNEDERLEKV